MNEKDGRKELDEFIVRTIASFEQQAAYAKREMEETKAVMHTVIQRWDKVSKTRFVSRTSKNFAELAKIVAHQSIVDAMSNHILWLNAFVLMNSIGIVHDRLNSLENKLGTKATSEDLGNLKTIVDKQEQIFQRIRELQSQTEESRRKLLAYVTR